MKSTRKKRRGMVGRVDVKATLDPERIKEIFVWHVIKYHAPASETSHVRRELHSCKTLGRRICFGEFRFIHLSMHLVIFSGMDPVQCHSASSCAHPLRYSLVPALYSFQPGGTSFATYVKPDIKDSFFGYSMTVTQKIVITRDIGEQAFSILEQERADISLHVSRYIHQSLY